MSVSLRNQISGNYANRTIKQERRIMFAIKQKWQGNLLYRFFYLLVLASDGKERQLAHGTSIIRFIYFDFPWYIKYPSWKWSISDESFFRCNLATLQRNWWHFVALLWREIDSGNQHKLNFSTIRWVTASPSAFNFHRIYLSISPRHLAAINYFIPTSERKSLALHSHCFPNGNG